MVTWRIWLMLFVVAVVPAGPIQAELQPEDFTPAAECGSCHQDIYQQWQTSYHSQSATSPVFWKLFEQAVGVLGSKGAGSCLSCHAPVATVVKEIPVASPITMPVELSPLASEGVTCDYCHTISGRENLGKDISVGAYRYPHPRKTDTKYGRHANAKTPSHPTKPSRLLGKSEFCGICHKYAHPVSGEVWQDTFAEWKASPYARQGVRCQDCHMPEYAGRSAEEAPERPDLHAHVFTGGGSEAVKRAAAVALWANLEKGADRRALQVKALVTNVGSGHLMPTGIPGIRQLWLEIVVRDADGKELARQQSEFGLELLDQEGNPTMPWQAVRIGRDTRLRPRQSRQEVLEVPLGGKDAEAWEIEATVYYRRLSERAAHAAATEPSAVVAISSDKLRIDSDGKTIRRPPELARTN